MEFCVAQTNIELLTSEYHIWSTRNSQWIESIDCFSISILAPNAFTEDDQADFQVDSVTRKQLTKIIVLQREEHFNNWRKTEHVFEGAGSGMFAVDISSLGVSGCLHHIRGLYENALDEEPFWKGK